MRWKLSKHNDTGPACESVTTTERGVPAGWPNRACCCPALPMVKIVMPATTGRRRPVDLYLCGHHYRISREAVLAADAKAYDARGRIDPLPTLAVVHDGASS